jgi:branched-chain amino acid transport system permease protein
VIAQLLVDSVVAASYIALGVVGLSMVYNILNFPSFAQGDLIASGAYLALAVLAFAGLTGAVANLGFGWTLILALICAAALNTILALAIDRAVFRRLRSKNASRISLIMASFGVSLMLRHIIVVFAGQDPHFYTFAIQPALRFWGIRIAMNELIVVVVTLVLVLTLHLFLTRTRLGKSMRAVAENPSLARVNGIDVDRVIRASWIIGTVMATVAGVTLGLTVQLHPGMGFELLLPMFAALIVGGMTSIYGALVGALLIGIAEGMTVEYIGAEYRQAAAFVLIILVLAFRPHGIAGEKA